MSELKVNKVTPRSGTTVTLGDSGDTITIPSGATISGALASTPAFQATLSATQNVSDNVDVKAQCNTEDFDTDSAYDNATNYRFTPQVAGKYFVYGQIAANNTTVYLQHTQSIIKKNGTTVKFSRLFNSSGFVMANNVPVVAIVDMNGTTDYVELFGFLDSDSGQNIFQDTHTYFGAYRLIGV